MNGNGLDLLIFGAHPDDAEIGMGATIAKHTQSGMKVGVCDLTQAEMSSNGTVELRAEEAAEATRILGLTMRSNLRLPDRGLYNDPRFVLHITREIRKHRPRVVFAPYAHDRHPDHGAAGRLVDEALFNAKLRRYDPDTEAFAVERMYYYFINDTVQPDVMVDATEVYDLKTEALRAYRSQFTPPDSSGAYVATPLNQGYLERVETRDRLLGLSASCGYAEGFMCKQPQRVHLF